MVALFPPLSVSRWKKKSWLQFQAQRFNILFSEKKKKHDVEEYFIVIITSVCIYLIPQFFFQTRHNANILLVMLVSIAMHMYLSATLLRYLETWILHQKHFKMNCFIETGLKSCSILRNCFVIQKILNSHNIMLGCIGWFCRQSKIDPKYCSR